MLRDRWQETLTGVAFRRLGGVSRRRPSRTRSELCHKLRPSEDRPIAALRDDDQALPPKAAPSQKNRFVRSPFSVAAHSVYMDRITRSRPFGHEPPLKHLLATSPHATPDAIRTAARTRGARRRGPEGRGSEVPRAESDAGRHASPCSTTRPFCPMRGRVPGL